MKLVNLTEHDITILRQGKVVLRLPPGEPARLSYRYPFAGRVGDVNLVERVVREVVGLPPVGWHDQLYVVSVQIWEYCRDRDDLLLPEFPVKDTRGRVIGCSALRTRRRIDESTTRRPSGRHEEATRHE